MEAKGRVFVIRPSLPTVKRTEKNIVRLEHFYEHGYETMRDLWPELCQWLENAGNIKVKEKSDGYRKRYCKN